MPRANFAQSSSVTSPYTPHMIKQNFIVGIVQEKNKPQYLFKHICNCLAVLDWFCFGFNPF